MDKSVVALLSGTKNSDEGGGDMPMKLLLKNTSPIAELRWE